MVCALLALSVIGVAGYGVDPTLVTIAGAVIAFGLLLLAWQRPTRFLVELVTRLAVDDDEEVRRRARRSPRLPEPVGGPDVLHGCGDRGRGVAE